MDKTARALSPLTAFVLPDLLPLASMDTYLDLRIHSQGRDEAS